MEDLYQIFIKREFLISTTRDFPKDKFQAQHELLSKVCGQQHVSSSEAKISDS